MTYYILVEFIIFAFLLVVTRHSFYRGKHYLHIFQQKGYKPKEYWSYLKGTQLSAFVTTAHLYVLPLFLIGLAEARLTPTSFALLLSIFGIAFFLPTGYITSDKPKKALAFTPRLKRQLTVLLVLYLAIVLTGINLGFTFRVFLPDITIMALFWLIGDMLMPLLVLLAAYFTKPIENRIQEGFKTQARQRIAEMPDLKIIAITGSYGKTSVKFMVKTLLEERYSVCFTPGSFNTPMGICRVINNDLQAHHQILVLEMGARYKGNITELCDIARPHVAIITNVGQAHLETFGSVENIAKTKGELLEGLHKNGIAVLNSDDKYVMGMPVRNDISVLEAGMDSGMYGVKNVSYGRKGCTFTVSDASGNEAEVQTRLLGEHTIRNLLLAFAAGHHFGLRLQTMAIAASHIEPVEHRLELKPAGPITIIDDAFNSNPVGARNAVDVLSQFTGGRRIIITPGMVELGDKEVEENRSWGEHIGKSDIDQVWLVGEQRTKPIAQGLQDAGYPEKNVRVFNSFFDARDHLQKEQKEGDVVLFENDLPDVYNEKPG